MQRDAEATRLRLITAGRAEFAARGLTGARVDRIAEAAQANKAQIYHYFKSKAGLFDAVWEDVLRETVEGLPLDVEDLPGAAALLCDAYVDHPELSRLITWRRLERLEHEDPAAPAAPAPMAHDVQGRIALIEQALRNGVIGGRFDADVLFALILHVAAFWEFTSPDVMASVSVTDREGRREVVRSVTAALLEGASEA
ncbi:AcrR family transcriptional regulator [Catenulispora sp. GP43]|uniref:TetR/AcrR family transcriptional regulator n=1 Tax=Catenulispora sp. GP43 TaxID=3156263 RepID=UPI0035179A60